MTGSAPGRAAGLRRVVAGLAVAASSVLVWALPACRSCPPDWLEHPPEQPGFLVATGSCGEVFALADARNLALTRAARRLADRLRIDVEARLSVVLKDGRLFVEAWGSDGPHDDLDGLELVELSECGDGTYVLVRLRET